MTLFVPSFLTLLCRQGWVNRFAFALPRESTGHLLGRDVAPKYRGQLSANGTRFLVSTIPHVCEIRWRDTSGAQHKRLYIFARARKTEGGICCSFVERAARTRTYCAEVPMNSARRVTT